MQTMDAANTARNGAKLSSAKSIGFRPGPLLAEKIATLQSDVAARGGSIDITDVIREGLLGCWPQVRTHLLVRHTTPPANADDVARLVAICAKALEHGVSPDQIEATLTAQMETALSPKA
jgi:hypothetical protein